MEKEKCDKGKDPKKCTPEQIKKCHGEIKQHQCDENKAEKKSDK